MKNSQTKERIITVLQSAITNMRININCLNGRTDIIKGSFYQVEAVLQECIRMCSQNSQASRIIMQKVLVPLMWECSKNLDDILKDSLQLRGNWDKLKRHNGNFRSNRAELMRLIRVYDPYASYPTNTPVTLETNEKTESAKLPEVKIDIDRHRKVSERLLVIKKLEELATDPHCYFIPLR